MKLTMWHMTRNFKISLKCFYFYLGISFKRFSNSNCVHTWRFLYFLTFPACFSIPIFFSNLNFNCSNLSSLRNLQGQVKKAFCYQKLFWPFTVWINCSSDLKNFANSQPSASNFKSCSLSLEHFFSQLIRTILATKYHF